MLINTAIKAGFAEQGVYIAIVIAESCLTILGNYFIPKGEMKDKGSISFILITACSTWKLNTVSAIFKFISSG